MSNKACVKKALVGLLTKKWRGGWRKDGSPAGSGVSVCTHVCDEECGVQKQRPVTSAVNKQHQNEPPTPSLLTRQTAWQTGGSMQSWWAIKEANVVNLGPRGDTGMAPTSAPLSHLPNSVRGPPCRRDFSVTLWAQKHPHFQIFYPF